MSSPEKSTELKGGHPPAVKAGGMRITQHKPTRDEKPLTNEPKKEENDNEKNDADEENDETEVVETAPKQNLIISGAVARGDEDFPTAAVKAYHEKPMPTYEFRPNAKQNNIQHQHIQQPRK